MPVKKHLLNDSQTRKDNLKYWLEGDFWAEGLGDPRPPSEWVLAVTDCQERLGLPACVSFFISCGSLRQVQKDRNVHQRPQMR